MGLTWADDALLRNGFLGGLYVVADPTLLFYNDMTNKSVQSLQSVTTFALTLAYLPYAIVTPLRDHLSYVTTFGPAVGVASQRRDN